MELTKQETAHVLACLRYYQKSPLAQEVVRESEHMQDITPLDDYQIDDLCERINMRGRHKPPTFQDAVDAAHHGVPGSSDYKNR